MCVCVCVCVCVCLILLFLKKGKLRITKNYSGITLTAIAAKVYNALLLNHIQHGKLKDFRKNQDDSWRNLSTNSHIDCRIIKWCNTIAQISLRHFIPSTEEKGSKYYLFWSPRNAYYYDDSLQKLGFTHPMVTLISLTFVGWVLQEDTFAPNFFIICQEYILWTLINLIKKKRFHSRRYSAETLTDADNTDLVLLANTPTQTKFLMQRLEQAVKCIGLHVNSDKTEFRCFQQEGTISTLNGLAFDINRPVLIPWQQYLIYWKRCQYTHKKSMDYYW